MTEDTPPPAPKRGRGRPRLDHTPPPVTAGDLVALIYRQERELKLLLARHGKERARLTKTLIFASEI